MVGATPRLRRCDDQGRSLLPAEQVKPHRTVRYPWAEDFQFAAAVSRMLLVAAQVLPELRRVPERPMNTLQEKITQALAAVLPAPPMA